MWAVRDSRIVVLGERAGTAILSQIRVKSGSRSRAGSRLVATQRWRFSIPATRRPAGAYAAAGRRWPAQRSTTAGWPLPGNLARRRSARAVPAAGRARAKSIVAHTPRAPCERRGAARRARHAGLPATAMAESRRAECARADRRPAGPASDGGFGDCRAGVACSHSESPGRASRPVLRARAPCDRSRDQILPLPPPPPRRARRAGSSSRSGGSGRVLFGRARPAGCLQP
jgi:hypothetical protein